MFRISGTTAALAVQINQGSSIDINDPLREPITQYFAALMALNVNAAGNEPSLQWDIEGARTVVENKRNILAQKIKQERLKPDDAIAHIQMFREQEQYAEEVLSGDEIDRLRGLLSSV